MAEMKTAKCWEKFQGGRDWAYPAGRHEARAVLRTLLAERNVNLYRIKLILGHKSLSSTERYLHGSQKTAWAEVQRVSMEMF